MLYDAKSAAWCLGTRKRPHSGSEVELRLLGGAVRGPEATNTTED